MWPKLAGHGRTHPCPPVARLLLDYLTIGHGWFALNIFFDDELATRFRLTERTS